MEQFFAHQYKYNKKIFAKSLFFIFNQLILKFLYYRDVIDTFTRIADNSPADYTSLKLSSYEYLALPKLSFEFDTQ